MDVKFGLSAPTLVGNDVSLVAEVPATPIPGGEGQNKLVSNDREFYAASF